MNPSVEELRRLRKAATKGLWSRRHNWSGEWNERPVGWRNEILIEVEPVRYVISVDGYTSDEDTEFIAYAANHALTLLEAAEARERELVEALRGLQTKECFLNCKKLKGSTVLVNPVHSDYCKVAAKLIADFDARGK